MVHPDLQNILICLVSDKQHATRIFPEGLPRPLLAPQQCSSLLHFAPVFLCACANLSAPPFYSLARDSEPFRLLSNIFIFVYAFYIKHKT